ncbi:hypothetical protein SAMN02744775_03644 [Enterobacter sp. CC120223-11]|nr:hypothetical protein SAMN02744775_03644 [Enterobacter sp. CC120223-11]
MAIKASQDVTACKTSTYPQSISIFNFLSCCFIKVFKSRNQKALSRNTMGVIKEY